MQILPEDRSGPLGHRQVIEAPWREVGSYAQLLGATAPAILWIGEPVDAAPPVELLFPELANPEVRTYHFHAPNGRPRVGLACVPQALVSGRSLVGTADHLYRLGPMAPAYIDDLLGDSEMVGDRGLTGKTPHPAPGVSVLLTHWNVATYGHWLLEGLPQLLLLRRLIAELPPFRILLPRSTPSFVQGWIDLVLPSASIEVYDDAAEYAIAEVLLMPTVLFVSRGHHFHPLTAELFDELLPPERGGGDGVLYVSRVQPNHFRKMTNQDEIEAIAVAEGLELIRPETLSLTEQIERFARARVVIGDFGSAMHNTMFSPAGTVVLCLNMVTGLQSRIAELRRHRLGYLLPSTGEPAMHRLPLTHMSYHIDPDAFRAHVRASLAVGPETDTQATPVPSRHDPNSTIFSATRPATRIAHLARRGVKVIWWTVTLQLPRRLRAYRAYRGAPPR